MLSITTSGGSFGKTSAKVKRLAQMNFYTALNRYGAMGVRALASATPTESGETASAWSYEIIKEGRHVGITWVNGNNKNGFPVAIMLQYGYGTGTGGYVQGRDYINPALAPIFEEIRQAVWKEVTRP